MPGKRVTLLGGKNIHELQLQPKESSVASEADEKQSGAKRTKQVAAFERCWSTALPRGLVYQISTTILLSPSLV